MPYNNADPDGVRGMRTGPRPRGGKDRDTMPLTYGFKETVRELGKVLDGIETVNKPKAA